MSINREAGSSELQMQYQKDFAIAFGLENGADAKYVFKVQNAPDQESVMEILNDFKLEKGLIKNNENEVEAPADAEQQLKQQQQRDHEFASEMNQKITGHESTIEEPTGEIKNFPDKKEEIQLDKAA